MNLNLKTSVAGCGGGRASGGGCGNNGHGREGGRAPCGSNLVATAAGCQGGHISYSVTWVAGCRKSGGVGCDSNLAEAKVSSHHYI